MTNYDKYLSLANRALRSEGEWVKEQTISMGRAG
jgi:hypothetical protein